MSAADTLNLLSSYIMSNNFRFLISKYLYKILDLGQAYRKDTFYAVTSNHVI